MTRVNRSRADPGYGVAPPGHRLPAETRVGAVRLQVADLGRSLPFYRDLLGFRVKERAAGRASLAAHDDDAVLVELRERRDAAPVPRRGRLGLFHFAILLPDRAQLGRLVRQLAEAGAPVGSSDHAVSEALYLQDPDGLGIEVYADRPRSTWQHRNRELTMVTEPLDIGGLVRAGGEAPWAGMPEGTAIGHVHLHVGDLDGAQAFYHEALGLDRVVWSYPGALFLSAGGYHHHLGVNTWAAQAAPSGEGDARLLEWEMVLPAEADVAEAAASLSSAGHPVERAADGAVVRDPWGTSLRLRAA